ncbi:MAG: hypothetical protein DWQ29_09015 [Planctomycetota bacterium]|nr:MAG: hypothetical protein DWQ29_09015 [Planctomycetota bacterium]
MAKGDFQRGIELQAGHADAVELSALREGELDALIEALPQLNLEGFQYVSFHAPSRRVELSEPELVDRLKRVADFVSAIIVHPDVIENFAVWKSIEQQIVIENMDQRKPGGRTAREIQRYFDELPEARFCFDIAHARQVDPTLSIGVEMLRAFSDRLVEVHISEVDASSQHVAISSAAMSSYREIASLIPESIPAIVESIVGSDAIHDEIQMAKASLNDTRVDSQLTEFAACR